MPYPLRLALSAASLALSAALEYDGPLADAWRGLDGALRGAAPSGDDFRLVAVDDARREAHHAMLASYARHDYAPLVAGLPIRSGEVVADAGGGTGVLAEMIAATFTDAEVVLLDLPEVGAIAKGRRCVRAIGADLFAPWPLAADVVVFARVLHDWDDEPALTLLRGARAALRPGGRVVILDAVLGPDRSEGGLCDLHVLAVTGGRDRTLVEFETLVARAGLRLRRTPVGGGIVQVVEALKG